MYPRADTAIITYWVHLHGEWCATRELPPEFCCTCTGSQSAAIVWNILRIADCKPLSGPVCSSKQQSAVSVYGRLLMQQSCLRSVQMPDYTKGMAAQAISALWRQRQAVEVTTRKRLSSITSAGLGSPHSFAALFQCDTMFPDLCDRASAVACKLAICRHRTLAAHSSKFPALAAARIGSSRVRSDLGYFYPQDATMGCTAHCPQSAALSPTHLQLRPG